jgi:hypothetical protein
MNESMPPIVNRVKMWYVRVCVFVRCGHLTDVIATRLTANFPNLLWIRN